MLRELEALYARNFQVYVRVAKALTGDRERAVEAVQDGFARAIGARSSFRGDGPLGAWVWRIVVNAARSAASAPLVEELLTAAPEREPEEAGELAPLIAALPERQRHAIFLRYYADLDYRSIASVLGIEVGTVSATLAAAHQTVRHALRKEAIGMIDVEPVIREELERLAPRAELEASDWPDVIRRATPQGVRRRIRRGRRVALVAAAALAAAAPAFALSSGVRSLLGFDGPKPVLAEADLLVSAPIGNGFYAHAWTSPSSTVGRCDFLTIDHSPVARLAVGRPNGVVLCGAIGGKRPPRAWSGVPLAVGVSVGRRPKSGVPSKWVPPIVRGAVLPSLRVARVAVIWNGGSLQLRLRDNNILGGSPQLYMPPFENFPYIVVAYNAQGKEIARKRLDSPGLMLMSGWKEYTREYKKWKQSRDG